MSKSSLIDITVPASTNNYSKGRSGRKIEMITIHHMAGILSAKRCGELFQNPNRKASSNYGIGYDGKIALYVDEENTSWANSNWDANCKSVTIETSNDKTGGDWHVGDVTLNSLIKLVADIAKRNNLGKLVKGKNLTWHQMYYRTVCPGDYLLSKLDYIVDEANKINEQVEPVSDLKIEKIDKKKIKLNKDANLWNLDFIEWKDAKPVKNYEKGTVIENIVAVATNALGGEYYMTEYSYNNNIHNGFNVVDCEDVIDIVTYTVKKNDNLSTIASKNNTTVKALVDLNASKYPSLLKNPNLIYKGWVLRIK